MEQDYENTIWWQYIDVSMQDLMRQSFDLLKFEKMRLTENLTPYHDYSYIVFSAAKAYEGFLKKVFRDMKLINSQQYYGEHFRIGRALSPSLPKRYRAGWVFGKLVKGCGGEFLPMMMWDVWKRARNRIFHYFPQHHECITIAEAEYLVRDIVLAMSRILEGCKLSGVERS